MSLSNETLARLRKEFPCKECPILTSPITAEKIGVEAGSRLRCETCNSTGIDWAAAYEALLERTSK